MAATRIAICENGRAFKVTAIVPFRDGGVAVTVPYTTDRTGLLLAAEAPDRLGLGDFAIPMDDVTAEYSASDRVKLSLHRDGFAQFSGRGIRSGKDENGRPKGLAIQMRRPFMHPIQTGPTFRITVWGLRHYRPLRNRERPDALIFEEDELLYRKTTPDRWTGYLVEGFVFPYNLLQRVKVGSPGKTVLPLFHPWYEGRGGFFDFRVLLLPNQPVFLGFLVSRIEVDFIDADGESVESGCVLNGPREYDGVGLWAFCPNPYAEGDGPPASLDWDPPTDPATGTRAAS